MCKNDVIAQLFPELKKACRNIRGATDDTLQETVIYFLTTKSETINEVFKNPDALFKMMCGKMKLETLRPGTVHAPIESVMNKKESIDFSARFDNEIIDYAINFLPDFDREVFLLYALDDFSYRKLSKETKIPTRHLFVSIQRSKKTLRTWIEKT